MVGLRFAGEEDEDCKCERMEFSVSTVLVPTGRAPERTDECMRIAASKESQSMTEMDVPHCVMGVALSSFGGGGRRNRGHFKGSRRGRSARAKRSEVVTWR